MENIFADRINDVPRSFIREILKVAIDPTVISFAGGLPNRSLFPVQELKNATEKVFNTYGRDIFQYSSSEGYPELRRFISGRYKKYNLDVSSENILITNGSQQGLDLLGKTIINKGDGIVMEEPGYLGAIQAFSIYKPEFYPIPVHKDGMDTAKLQSVIIKKPKLIYTVPNFQNPSGISYSQKNRHEISEIVKETDTLIIEDDPYGELRFKGESKTSFKKLLPDNTILLGSFSKTIIPGFRLGWIVAPDHIMQKLIIAKQATDLHTSHFTQSIIYQYLKDCDMEKHIAKIKLQYGAQCRAMQDSIKEYFPECVEVTEPEGGMFLWAELPQNMAALDLFDIAVKDKVVFVPGDPFYINNPRANTLRLNFSCVDEKTIRTGIKRLGNAIFRMMDLKEKSK